MLAITTPWGATSTIPASDTRISFKPDWSASNIRAHQADARATLARPWTLSANGKRVAWTPKPSDVDRMLTAITRTTGDDVKVVTGGPPPQLEVVAMNGTVVAGAPSILRLTVRNNGKGRAYRVIVETRSGEISLHRKRFVFGSIAAGASSTRSLSVNIPATHKGGSAVIVLRFSEANGNTPEQVTKRLSIVAGKTAQLRLRCTVRKGARSSKGIWIADADARLTVRCSVTNTGQAAATGTIIKGSLARMRRASAPRNLRPRRTSQASLIFRVPANATTGQRFQLSLQANETSVAKATATQTLVIEVGQQRICAPPISRAQYNRKLARLRKDLADGLIDKATFQTYEAQLVGCLR